MPRESGTVLVTFATRPDVLVVAQQLSLVLVVRSASTSRSSRRYRSGSPCPAGSAADDGPAAGPGPSRGRDRG